MASSAHALMQDLARVRAPGTRLARAQVSTLRGCLITHRAPSES